MKHHDLLLRFNFDQLDIRGELVYLNDSWQQILARYDYPEPVRQQLGNAMAALVLCWLLTSNPEEATFDFSPEAARCA